MDIQTLSGLWHETIIRGSIEGSLGSQTVGSDAEELHSRLLRSRFGSRLNSFVKGSVVAVLDQQLIPGMKSMISTVLPDIDYHR